MANDEFPETIHVLREEDGTEDTYLTVREDGIDGIEEDRRVATYRLVEVGEVKVTREVTRVYETAS